MLQDFHEKNAIYFDYSSAANPLKQELIPPVPYKTFSPKFFDTNVTSVMPLDVSDLLKCTAPATSPALCANFIKIVGGYLSTSAEATSHLFYIHAGSGKTDIFGSSISWNKGDFIVLPSHEEALHTPVGSACMYWVHDAPLLRYLGVKPALPRFSPTLYKFEKAQRKLDQVASNSKSSLVNRVSVLLANTEFSMTRTISQTLLAMYGLLPSGKSQLPHRHQAAALDFVIDCKPGCYTLLGTDLNENGWIKNPHREDWAPGGSFITPPGYWHSHHNESGQDAYVLPILDAGLHEFLRSLDIQFSHINSDGSHHVSDIP
jgi:gentisate 1,2-dioxygenase